MTEGEACYPYPAPIDAYGNGGFRFADMSHRGSILCLPSGIHAWPVASADNLRLQDLDRVLQSQGAVNVLLLGTGERQIWPAPEIRRAFEVAGIALEPMSTGSAARTYNVLLAERRLVGAALIAVA